MRYISIMSAALLITIAMGCRKNNNTHNTAWCATCNDTLVAHTMDADSVFYFLPTAFTPNGDGVNDVLRLSYGNLNTDSSSLTIWDMNGRQVYGKSLSQGTTGWDGVDMNGNKCAAGHYPVRVRLVTNKGSVIDLCACVAILQHIGNCTKTNGVTYYFPDQLDPASGFVYPTNEQLCP